MSLSVEDLRGLSLFDGLSDAQLAALLEVGTEVQIDCDVDLFEEGKPADDWWVLIDGALALRRHLGREDTVVGRMDVPGRWAGGFRAWDAHGVYLATGRGVATGRVLKVPSDALRRLSDAWFPFGGHLIQGLYGTARSIEATARQREPLVTLGKLAAGLAHEINNPAAAATRAVSELDSAGGSLLASLGRLAQGEMSAAQFSALDALRLELQPTLTPVGALAMADREDAISSWLDDHGVERDWLIAPPLAASGADVAWCERVLAALGPDLLEPGLDWVSSTLSATNLIEDAKESIRRITDLVSAVRSYSQMDRGSLQRIDVTEGLESTLVMLGARLRDGVKIVRSYGDGVPKISAYAGELNQVWTNLIDNALDAMGGSGTLTITTRAEGNEVVVEIGDTGVGMPPAVVARAFEPFYTTKEVGKGTGLGLDIAQRIVVEHHGGAITIDSSPGNTVVDVRLPLRPPA